MYISFFNCCLITRAISSIFHTIFIQETAAASFAATWQSPKPVWYGSSIVLLLILLCRRQPASQLPVAVSNVCVPPFSCCSCNMWHSGGGVEGLTNSKKKCLFYLHISQHLRHDKYKCVQHGYVSVWKECACVCGKHISARESCM